MTINTADRFLVFELYGILDNLSLVDLHHK